MGDGTIMMNLFKTKAEAAGGEVHRFSGEAGALSFVMDFLKKEGVAELNGPTAVWADPPLLTEVRKKELSESMPGLKFNVDFAAASQAKIGISRMDWAIADTGTLLQNATAVERRLVSMLPDIHVAFVSTGRILPDLAAALSAVSPRDAAYLTFITGPSRTADIERVLTIGVHGPERLIIVFVDQRES